MALPGAVFADGYRVNLTTNSCAATGHTATLAFKAIADPGKPADSLLTSFIGQVRRNGSWHNVWGVAGSEDVQPNSNVRQTFPLSDHITNARHRVRLRGSVGFQQSDLTVWEWSFTSRAC